MVGECKYVNPKIIKFYFTEWSETIIPIYSGNNIIERYDLVGQWYEIKINTAAITYSQEMSTKNANGIYYNEIINISMPKAENIKWLELVDLLYAKKYIIVFEDNNSNWFTAGYRWGAYITAYQLSDNQYVISFVSPHANNLPTLIEEDYVYTNIIS